MKRKVLLIEPNYKNKYPPIGLMKLATYHRMLGDEVRFFKGELKDFVIDEIANELVMKLKTIEKDMSWGIYLPQIKTYLKKGTNTILEELTEKVSQKQQPIIIEWFKYYYGYYRKGDYKKNPKWDRVCISTLFTFH